MSGVQFIQHRLDEAHLGFKPGIVARDQVFLACGVCDQVGVLHGVVNAPGPAQVLGKVQPEVPVGLDESLRGAKFVAVRVQRPGRLTVFLADVRVSKAARPRG